MIHSIEDSFNSIELLNLGMNNNIDYSINNDDFYLNIDGNGLFLSENNDSTFCKINMEKTIREEKNIFKTEKLNTKVLRKKFAPTKLFIQSLLGLNLSSYQVNRIIKLIKTGWIYGIYSLLNDKLNCLFVENKIKAQGFIFEFLYIKTSLIESDNSVKNLSILDIFVKDLITGKIFNSNNNKKIDIIQNNEIRNNKKLIEFINNIVYDKEYQNNERLIKEAKDILIILEKKISFFIEAVWNINCNEIEKEFRKFCSKEILINKFKKSKEIYKIIINIIEGIFPEKIKKMKPQKKQDKLLTKKDNNLYINYLSELEEEKTELKNNIEEIIQKFLEISKKEKFELYFQKKIAKKYVYI